MDGSYHKQRQRTMVINTDVSHHGICVLAISIEIDNTTQTENIEVSKMLSSHEPFTTGQFDKVKSFVRNIEMEVAGRTSLVLFRRLCRPNFAYFFKQAKKERTITMAICSMLHVSVHMKKLSHVICKRIYLDYCGLRGIENFHPIGSRYVCWLIGYMKLNSHLPLAKTFGVDLNSLVLSVI